MNPDAAAVAAFGLRSTRSLPKDFSEEAFTELLNSCEQHRLLGLLAGVIRSGGRHVAPEQEQELERRWRAWLTHDLRVERLLLRATAVLDRAGIESRVLKGVALAHTAYDDPADRVFADVDLLVPGDELTRAATVLTAALGAERPVPEIRPGFDDRFGKEAMLKVDGLELDLHRTFVEGAYGLTINLEDLFAPPYRFPLGTCELEALPQPQRLLHACYSAALGDWPPRLSSLRDVAQIILRECPHVADVLLMARGWRCEAVVARAVTSAWTELALVDRSPLVEWALGYQLNRSDRILMAAHLGPARAFTRHLVALGILHGVSTRLAYARAIAFPQRSYLETRGLNARSHAQRAWRRIRGG